MEVRSLCWLGIRTAAFADTVRFFRSTLELPLGSERPGFARFDLPHGGLVEVFDRAEPEHLHFTTGPVIGFEVADFDAARSQLEARGCELVGRAGGERGAYRWQHFRGPEGIVFEIVDRPERPRPPPPSGELHVNRIAWMGISASNFESLVAFYRGVLELRVVESTTDLVECSLPDGTSVEAFRRGGPLDHPHFRTGPVPGFGVDDVGEAMRVLAGRGVAILESRVGSAGGWAHFRAPDGHVYEVKQSARA